MKAELILTPTDFVALANQTLEVAFGFVKIEGELANFHISKNRWIYFDIKDEFAKVSCFATIYALPGPLQDGMLVQISGQPRIHPQFGFSVTVQNIQPSGEGSLKKAFELLKAKLSGEGLFDLDRKRTLSYPPQKIALITSKESAAYADFVKIISARWPFVNITIFDVLVQGENAPLQIVKAITMANTEAQPADVLVLTRGGGGADDLAAFNDERVVRAISASRIPTLVAIGHEIDEALGELAADKRASTPSNAAELLVPDEKAELAYLGQLQKRLSQDLRGIVSAEEDQIINLHKLLVRHLKSIHDFAEQDVDSLRHLLLAYNPENVLKRGYALIKKGGVLLRSVKSVHVGDHIKVQLSDGKLGAQVETVNDKVKE